MLVFLKQNNSRQKEAREAMSITFHELGHASHDEIQNGYNSRAGKKDGESWANGIEYLYMKSFFGDNYKSDDGGETYTNLTECLINNGFNITQIQDGFINSRSWVSWQGQISAKAASALTKEKFVNFIFDNPNLTKYDLRKIITTTPKQRIYRNELGMVSFIEDPNKEDENEDAYNEHAKKRLDIFSIDDIRFSDADFTILESDDMSKFRPFMYSKQGVKTIKTHVAELDEWYETQVTIHSFDIFDTPINNGIEGYTFSYKIQPMLDKNSFVLDWGTPEPDGKVIDDPLNPYCERSAAFYFKTAGKKRIEFELYYGGLPSPMTVKYERTVDIEKASDDNMLFNLIDPPLRFLPNTWYAAKMREDVMLLGMVKAVQLVYNWNYSLPPYYENEDWTYDPLTRILRFRTLEYLDCIIRISFDGKKIATTIPLPNI